MHDPQATAFSKAILERALTDYAQTAGDLGPTDPLDIAGVKAVAAELDVPDAYVDAALANPIVHAPTMANGYTITVEQFMAADPDAILRSAKPILLSQFRHQVVGPTPNGATFKPVEGANNPADPYNLSGLADFTLTCIPLGLPSLRATRPSRTHDNDTGTIVQATGQLSNPLASTLPAAIGMGIGFGHIPGVLLYHFTSVSNDISRNVAFIGILIAAVAGAVIAYRFWRQDAKRLTLQVTGVLDRIKRDLPTNAVTTISVPEDEQPIPLGSLIQRMIRRIHNGKRSAG